MKRKSFSLILRQTFRTSGIFFLLCSTIFYSFGGLDLYFGLKTPFAPKSADAAYSGKQLKTIEYVLGDGSENVARGIGVISYAGASWNAAKATAGQKLIVIEGTNIRVVNAYLDVSFQITASVNMTGLDVFFDASSSAFSGTDVPVSEVAGNTPYGGTGLSGYFRGTHDVTSFFATTTDANWSSGVGVVAAASTTFSAAANRTLTAIKLFITYESDYSAASHNEVKSVRFPLSSNNGSDTGTRQAQCGVAATCGFTYNANIPDAIANGDILDVYFEIHAQVDSGVASTLQPQISGGTAGPAYAWGDAIADNPAVNVIFRPTVGAPDFTRSAAQTLNIINGLDALNLVGAELVVTYRYSTGAAAQTETVRYFIDQDTTNPGTATSSLASTTVTISNSGRSVKNIWYRIHTAPIAAGNLVIGSEVGTTTKRFKQYALSATNARAGDTPTVIQDMSADIGNFWDVSVLLGGETRATVSNAPVGVEAFVTFTWDGSSAATVTKTVTYSGAQQGTTNVANVWNNRPVFLELPETVTKTYRSAYLFTNYMHSNAAATIAAGTVTIGVSASTTVITENGDTEEFNARYLTKVASSTFSGGDTIPWVTRAIEINETKNVANMAYFGNEVVITYDVALGGVSTTASPKQLKTVEYLLAGESERSTRANGVVSYAGSGWATTKGGAGTKSVKIEGTNIRVVNAYLEVGFIVTAAVNVNGLDVFFDVNNSSGGGTDVPVGESTGVTPYSNTGLTGYIRGNHDVTAFFDRESDANWSAGVGVVAGASTTFSGAGNRELTTIKLVITYESDYSLVPHNEVKTVRFPLDSTAGTDTGTKQTACGISAVCAFTYTANIPDAVADADILDVHFEMHAEVNSGAAANFDFQITSMPSPSSLYNWTEVNTDDNTINVMYAPPVGGSGFQRNTAQTLNIDNGAVALNALGGELVVTYRYSTGATAQTDTVRYFINQATSTPGTTRSNFATITPTISNGTLSVKNIWYKVHVAPPGAATLTVFGKVGTTTEKSNVYTFAATNPRAGDTPTLIYSLSADVANFWTSTTTLAASTQFSAAAGVYPPAIEAYITFTWNGSLGGTTTHSVLFSGAQQGVTNVANTWNNRPTHLDLPETVTKTFRSTYIEATHSHSNAAGTITLATTTIGANGTTTAIRENGDTEAFNAVYFVQVASSTFSSGNTIAWTRRYIDINETKSVANYSYFSNTIVTTYDAAQEYKNPTFTQNYYRLYADNDALKPTVAWPSGGGGTLGENTALTAADSPPGNGTRVRIRMSLQVATTTMLASSTQFKLQFAPKVTTCSAIGSWNDFGNPGSVAAWRGFNATPVDGTNLSLDPPTAGDLVLSVSDRAGLYEESNGPTSTPFAVAVGEDVEYDWNVQNNNAATDTPYCFRMVKADGTAFWTYSNYPTITTQGYTAESKNWKWYDDETNETPSNALAVENTAPSNISNTNVVKLRLTLNETAGSNGLNQKFKMQYSEYSDFSAGVNDVVSTTTCAVNSVWCYGDGVDTDNNAISTLLLSDSAQKGTHNEGTTTTTFGPLASTATEFEFTLKHAGALANTTYFFRVYDLNHARPVPLASGKTYPSLSTEGGTLTVVVSGVATTTATEGITTDVGTSATVIPFGTVALGSTGVKSAQRLDISTNASQGYQVLLKANGLMLSSYGGSIPDVTGTNASPSTWALGCAVGATGCWGYHGGDNTLSAGSTRFLSDDTYAQFATTTSEEVIYNSGPVANDITDMIYRIEAHLTQTAGAYTTQLQYIVVPIF